MPKKNSGWMRNQSRDPYYTKAKKMDYRSRSAFKLLQIQKKTMILKPGQKVIDLCCAPGGWLKIIKNQIGSDGEVLGIDIEKTRRIEGVTIKQLDMLSPDFISEIPPHFLKDVDVVVSDCSPKTIGTTSVDQFNQVELSRIAWELSKKVLKKGGIFVSKFFQGKDADDFLIEIREGSEKVKVIKPRASRKKSREMYIVSWIR